MLFRSRRIVLLIPLDAPQPESVRTLRGLVTTLHDEAIGEGSLLVESFYFHFNLLRRLHAGPQGILMPSRQPSEAP